MTNGSRRLCLALFAIALGTTSCGDSDGITEPRPPPVEVHPELIGFFARVQSELPIFKAPSTLRPPDEAAPTVDAEPFPGIIVVGGYQRVSIDSVPDGAWLRVTVRTDGGDVEEMVLPGPSGLCRPRPDVSCWAVEVDVPHLDAARTLIPLVAEHSGVIAHVEAYDEGQGRATVHILLPDRAEDAVAYVRRWPGVGSAVQRVGAHRPEFPRIVVFHGWLPADPESPITQGDGVLQVTPGESFVVEYHQPDGSTLVQPGVVE